MSLRNEKIRALLYTRDFMRDLLDRRKTPRVPKAIRERASACLRHYPFMLDIAIKGDAGDKKFHPIKGEDIGFGQMFEERRRSTLSDILEGKKRGKSK